MSKMKIVIQFYPSIPLLNKLFSELWSNKSIQRERTMTKLDNLLLEKPHLITNIRKSLKPNDYASLFKDLK